MKNNQKGFSIAEILMVIVVVGVISSVGWLIYDRQEKKANNQTTTDTADSLTANPPSNLSKYKDDYVSFSYPSDWKVEKQYTFTDDYGAYKLNLTAPIDTNQKSFHQSSSNLSLRTSILIAKNNHFGVADRTCREDCTVYYLDKISPKSPASEGSLVISDWGSQGHPSTVEYTRSDVAINTKTYELGLAVDSAYYARIYGSFMSGDLSQVRLATNTDFQNSTSYKELKELVTTITFNTSMLPQ